MKAYLTQSLQQFGNVFQDLFFPPACLNCRELINRPADVPLICPTCLQSLKPPGDDFGKIHILNRLIPCYIDELWIAFEFNEVIRTLLHGIKYQKMPRLGNRAGRFVSRSFAARLKILPEYLVLPIPLHIVRKKEREYNQSSYIARGLFEKTGNEVAEDLLLRKRYTATQTKLNRAKRQLNVKDAFIITNEQYLQDKAVVLVDDVVTTGATMNECARLLKECGAKRVIGMALATPVEGAG